MVDVFSAVEPLMLHIIAVLFCWHFRQRSERGFITMIDGTKVLHNRQNVVYATAWTVVMAFAAS
jgi:hypothetical protein